VPGDLRAAGVLDRRAPALEVFSQLRGAQADLEPMSIGVQRKEMSLRVDLADELGPAPDLLTHQEECRLVSRPREDLEDRRRPLGVRAVVERQRDPRSVWERPRKPERSRGVCIHWCKNVAEH
jgi:hypothetical protein